VAAPAAAATPVDLVAVLTAALLAALASVLYQTPDRNPTKKIPNISARRDIQITIVFFLFRRSACEDGTAVSVDDDADDGLAIVLILVLVLVDIDIDVDADNEEDTAISERSFRPILLLPPLWWL
jgi:hypothetical protein